MAMRYHSYMWFLDYTPLLAKLLNDEKWKWLTRCIMTSSLDLRTHFLRMGSCDFLSACNYAQTLPIYKKMPSNWRISAVVVLLQPWWRETNGHTRRKTTTLTCLDEKGKEECRWFQAVTKRPSRSSILHTRQYLCALVPLWSYPFGKDIDVDAFYVPYTYIFPNRLLLSKSLGKVGISISRNNG